MSVKSEMVDDKETSLAAVTDDSCTMKYIEIVPLDRAPVGYRGRKTIIEGSV